MIVLLLLIGIATAHGKKDYCKWSFFNCYNTATSHLISAIVVGYIAAELNSAVEGSGEKGFPDGEPLEEKEKLANLQLRSASTCANGSERATFVRVPQAFVMGIPTIVSSAEMIDCAEFCRNNTEPLSGLPRPCKGFNFQSNVVPTCEFFDDQSKVNAALIASMHHGSLRPENLQLE